MAIYHEQNNQKKENKHLSQQGWLEYDEIQDGGLGFPLLGKK